MVRVYLSPTATTFAKIGLVIAEILIDLFNLVSWPIRKVNAKAYMIIAALLGILYVVAFHADLRAHLVGFSVVLGMFAVSIFTCRALHKYFKSYLSPKIAEMINSPLGIRTNRFHKLNYQ